MSGRGGAWLLGVVAAVAVACSAPAPPSTTAAAPGPAAPSTAGCAVDVAPAPLPGWARSRFSPPDQPAPFILGERGAILGVLFGQPLSAAPAPDRGNKILWVTREPHPVGPLMITAGRRGLSGQLLADRPTRAAARRAFRSGRAAALAAGLAVSTTVGLLAMTAIAGADGGALATLFGEAGVSAALFGPVGGAALAAGRGPSRKSK